MVSVDASEEAQWRFLFDLHGVISVPSALDTSTVRELNQILDEHIASDTDNSWRTLRFPGAYNGLLSSPSLYNDIIFHCSCAAVLSLVLTRTAVYGSRCTAVARPENVQTTLLDWGKAYRDVLAVPKLTPILDALLGPRFRLDHIYLDVIKPPLPSDDMQQVRCC